MSHVHEELLSRMEAMKETLHSEWGAEHDHFRAELARERADDVVDIALAPSSFRTTAACACREVEEMAKGEAGGTR
jgi:hypothetical protein